MRRAALPAKRNWLMGDNYNTLGIGHGMSANTIITEGDPALEIVSEAERGEYDLIVLGATGASDLKHDMLGSVSTRVAQDAPCSVFVARFIE